MIRDTVSRIVIYRIVTFFLGTAANITGAIVLLTLAAVVAKGCLT